ncbi:glycerophosphodiester phosphodiesterase family protein [Riemerella anatipestifer]|uniref:glycerophosphodiester phosphodiesterase family protein n=1 Tax=Riemerella anatipestifer TaxID=34085 RepID=UPI002A8B48FF|nr:glycerophosphodiester phosphodiesterase family protein [Riemerella anatipestifer]MDY3521271.1 glycerophosphodiester phosphodiesterase family protein [Riemerella anatipestifer]MDY3534101.1 glycerophosphodiester phosphodiesterase family protein [Riemerella anatipestifer]MDY3535776.1 glycerophosphodiester phosphodiesterase family protein [Riemerella anatipestifer]
MLKNVFRASMAACVFTMLACNSDREVSNPDIDVSKVEVKQLSPEMIKVRDYVPENAVIAHRGSTFWTPEETEAAFRWGREIGADYLEADLQVSKDGVVLALHDDNLKRTTNIEIVYGEHLPSTRKQYYLDLGYSSDEADKMVEVDRKNFYPNLPSSYTYEELLKLDAGTWFNETNPEQARAGFTTQRQYISSLEDMIMYSRGYKLKRNADGTRAETTKKLTDKTMSHPLSGVKEKIVKYTTQYVKDEQDTGHRPGIYVEFKEPWLNPSEFEKMVYDELDLYGMNIITKPEAENSPFYVNGKVNVGNTNGKVILQTFSLQSLKRIKDFYQGKVPMCFLLWKGNGATDMSDDSPEGYASFINLGVENLAHFAGPSISGAPNNYPEMLKPWQADLIRRSNMKIHPYSFDTKDQMKKYFGDYNYGNSIGNLSAPPYCDAMFTNRAEETLHYYIEKNARDKNAAQSVENSSDLLKRLGY